MLLYSRRHKQHFNPRSPHGERLAVLAVQADTRRFQSTLPARGATWRCWEKEPTREDFNPRSPHGERQTITNFQKSLDVFQSTLPARGATTASNPQRSGENISIHAPRTGSDKAGSKFFSRKHYFNPRSPHGERQDVDFMVMLHWYISIHAPRTGSDDPTFYRYKLEEPFQSTLPARGATAVTATSYRIPYFNPRSPHGERHALWSISVICPNYFNPRSPHGERRHAVA